MWLRGIFPGVSWPRPPSDSIPPGLHVPLGFGLEAKVGAGAALTPIPSPDERSALTPVALHRQTAQTCRSFLFSCSFICGEVSFLAVSELLHFRHDVGNLRQWAPRRDYIRFWRYVDWNIQWLHGVPPFVASETSMRSCPQGIWPLTTRQIFALCNLLELHIPICL